MLQIKLLVHNCVQRQVLYVNLSTGLLERFRNNLGGFRINVGGFRNNVGGLRKNKSSFIQNVL